METQTVFRENGNIYIYPCDFELGNCITCGGERVSQKGRMVTDHDGTSRFYHYAKGTGSRYKHLFQTCHGQVKESKENLIITLRLPKRLGKELIEQFLKQETEEMAAFIQTRQTFTKW